MKKEVIAILLFVILFGCAQDVNVPINEQNSPLHVSTLPNGMTVTTQELHATPLVTIQFWVHTGSKNENNTNNGIAHIFEHIWFKGTATQPVGSFHKRVEALGGELNAMTSTDWTMFYVTVPADKFDDIFPNMVDLLLHPAFNETEIAKETQVVLEEQRFSLNDPQRFVDDQFGLLLIDEHPYRNPTIGYPNTILNATQESIKHFYTTWYVPNNMNIVIVGDINELTVRQKIANAFKDFQQKPVPLLHNPVQKAITTPKYNSSFRSVGNSYIALGYLAPSANDTDKYAFTVLNAIFSSGESSRLQHLKQNNTLTSANSYYLPLNDMGVFELVAVIDPAKKGEAIAQILTQINTLKTTPVSPEELQRAKNQIKADTLRSQEEVFQIGFDIGKAWINGDVNEYTTYLTNINKVTSADVQRIADQYFIAHTMYEVKPNS